MTKNKQRPARILYWLQLRGLSSAEIGRRLGISRAAVCDVLAGRRTGPKVWAEIKEALKMKKSRNRGAWIRYQLRRQGLSGAEISRRAGVSQGYVCDVIAGRRKGQKVREEIARVLNKEVNKIFKEE